MNAAIVMRELNLPNTVSPESSPITKELAIQFVKKVSQQKAWNEDTQALIDACFADPKSLPFEKNKITLTPALQATFDAIRNVKYEDRFKTIKNLSLAQASMTNKNLNAR